MAIWFCDQSLMSRDRSFLERLGPWMRRRSGWQRVLLILMASWLSTAIILPIWIGLVILLNRDPARPVSAEAALNLLLVAIIAIAGLPLMHAGQYRWFWHIDHKRGAGRLGVMESAPRFGSERTEPSPAVPWPGWMRVRHVLIHLVGMAILLITFAPYGNQRAIVHLLHRFSAGTASYGSLAGLLFGYVPLALFCLLAMLLTQRQMKRRDAGLLDAEQSLVLNAEVNWLFSFGAAFLIAALLCRFAGMIIRYLA